MQRLDKGDLQNQIRKGKEIIYHYLSCGWVGGDGGGLLWLMM